MARKQPGRLVLEEHGHCEVPAGCGGVVLRWRNPHAALPLTMHLYTPGKAASFLDGQPLVVGLPDVAPGRHVIAFRIDEVERSAGLLLFSAVHEPQKYQPVPPADLAEHPVKILSAPDGTWKFSLDPPGSEQWTAADFADSGWLSLIAWQGPQLSHEDAGYWQWSECNQAGAGCLGLPDPVPGKGTVWVRKTFDLSPPEERRPPQGGPPS